MNKPNVNNIYCCGSLHQVWHFYTYPTSLGGFQCEASEPNIDNKTMLGQLYHGVLTTNIYCRGSPRQVLAFLCVVAEI
jgi:hypothetical protein